MVKSRLSVLVAVLTTVGVAAVVGGEARSSGVVLPPGNAAAVAG